MSFPDQQRVIVYIGVGAWIDGPFAHSDRTRPDQHMSADELLSALGLTGEITSFRKR